MSKENNPDYYKSYFQYLNPTFSIEWYRYHMIADFPEIITADKQSKVLDLGCGTGQLLKVLEDLGYTNLSGIEYDKGQFEEAKKLVPHAELKQGDIFVYLKEMTQKYDMVFMVDVIEHIQKDDIVALLTLIQKVLAPGGKLFIRTPNADFPLTAPRFRYIDITHTTIFTQESMATLLRLSGFSSFAFRPSYIPRSGIKKIFFEIIRIIGDSLLRLYLYVYIHEAAKRAILSPNFNTVAVNEGSK
jgi:2-polyprenyl-3-methyl-5-hydroxy-6-metoxy-1,4-benzoquinol methylase